MTYLCSCRWSLTAHAPTASPARRPGHHMPEHHHSRRPRYGAFIDLAIDARQMAGLIDRDPAVLAMIDERLPRTSYEMTGQVITVLAGPDADRSTVLRAHAALAVIKGATMAALELGGERGPGARS